MGKAARERARRKAQKDATPELIVPPEELYPELMRGVNTAPPEVAARMQAAMASNSPQTNRRIERRLAGTYKPRTPAPAPTAPTTTKQPWMCRVVGCTSLALECHDGPGGDVWLCGSCGRIARRNLAAEAAKEAFADQVAALHKPMLEHYERERRRIYGQHKHVERAKPGDVLRVAGSAPRS